jgi:hypothetical protein
MDNLTFILVKDKLNPSDTTAKPASISKKEGHIDLDSHLTLSSPSGGAEAHIGLDSVLTYLNLGTQGNLTFILLIDMAAKPAR